MLLLRTLLLLCLAIPSLLPGQSAVIASHDRLNAAETLEKPYLVLVSLDGFRHDYLTKYDAPQLKAIAQQGVQAESLIPGFPSSTFPNHYSIVTGLYPSHHGLVSNTFFDPASGEKYQIGDREKVENGRWYGGTPIWVHAEQQGMRSASYFWVGTEADVQGVHPWQYFKYNKHVKYKERVKQAIEWLNMPPEARPHFIMLYFSLVDTEGHRHGPDSKEVKEAVEEVDKVIGTLWKKLQKLDLPINLMVVSDHGMVAVKRDQPIYLNALTDLENYEVASSSGVIHLLYARDKDSLRIEKTLTELREKAEGRYVAYRADNMPAHLHFDTGERRGDIVVYALAPYVFGTPIRKPSPGAHGFDPYQTKDVHGIFYAIGSHFKSQVRLGSFENVHVFPAIMEILQLAYEPEAIDGTIRAIGPALKLSDQ
jgi:predicted AlkP superfamily pyrophosphatase or phosphodiesterase